MMRMMTSVCRCMYVCMYVKRGTVLASLATEVLPRAVGAAGPLSKYKGFSAPSEGGLCWGLANKFVIYQTNYVHFKKIFLK